MRQQETHLWLRWLMTLVPLLCSMSQICSSHLMVYIMPIGWLTAGGRSLTSHHWQGGGSTNNSTMRVRVSWVEVKWGGTEYFCVRIPTSTTKCEKVHKDGDLSLPTTRLNKLQGRHQQDALTKYMSVTVVHPSSIDFKTNTCSGYQGAFPSGERRLSFSGSSRRTELNLVRWSLSQHSSLLCRSHDNTTLLWRSLFQKADNTKNFSMDFHQTVTQLHANVSS